MSGCCQVDDSNNKKQMHSNKMDQSGLLAGVKYHKYEIAKYPKSEIPQVDGLPPSEFRVLGEKCSTR